MANAIQMAITAAVKQAMGNLPPEIVETIGQIGGTVTSFKAQLDRIENQNREILSALERIEHGSGPEKQHGSNDRIGSIGDTGD